MKSERIPEFYLCLKVAYKVLLFTVFATNAVALPKYSKGSKIDELTPMETIKVQHPQLNLNSAEEMLRYAHAQNAQPKTEVLKDLDFLVAPEKARYESLFKDYLTAIKEYEDLSSEFDAMLRAEVKSRAISDMDGELRHQAQNVLKLERQVNTAYLTLMAKYDKAVPVILAKHF